jgi:signal transduction histidine kinase
VHDGGPGISPDDLPHLFERFFRGKATRKADGLGLGLYIVQLLVEAHEGRVWAESRPGEGATFTFTLPRA